MINRDELYKFYIEENHTRVETAKYFKLSVSQIYRYIKKYDLVKDRKLISKRIEKSFIEKYNITNISKLNSIKDKKKETFKKHYDTEYYFKTEEFKKQAKKTKLIKYDDCNFNNRNKAKEFCLEKYGVENPSQIESVKDKKVETTKLHYGVDNPSQNALVQQKKVQTLKKHYNVENPMHIPSVVEKVVKRSFETRKRNGTFNGKAEITINGNTIKCSSAEKYGYDKLTKIFNQVEFQYKSKLYPFACDFYIPEKDLYIEFQITWEHGKEPFINSEQQRLIIDTWKNKNNKWYNSAIKTWTIRDPLKRETAKKNHLNWLEFFTLKEFDDYFKIIY